MKSLADKKWETKLSSAGLVYLHFGEQIIAELSDLSEKDSVTGLLYSKMYDNFIEEIDGIDNGISQYDGEPRCVDILVPFATSNTINLLDKKLYP